MFLSLKVYFTDSNRLEYQLRTKCLAASDIPAGGGAKCHRKRRDRTPYNSYTNMLIFIL